MHPTNFWHKLDVFRYQVIFFAAITSIFLSNTLSAQDGFQKNLPGSDDRWLHYGFSIGIHNSGYRITYSDAFVTPGLDSLHSIMPARSIGFSLGFITDFRLADQFNLRVLPKVSFYEFPVDFNFTSNRIDRQLIESTFVEMPVLLKYKSERYRNVRMYMVGGVAPGIEASGRRRRERSENRLTADNINLALEVGAGIDIYYPLFKFSPEIRYSRGLTNVIQEDRYGYSTGIRTMSPHVISIYLQFSD